MKFMTDHSINIQNVATGEERNTLLHWHMYPATELNMAPPEPKFIYEDTPGVDGSLDVTEDTADRVLYNDRNGEWEFYITNKPLDVPNIDDTISWAQMQSDLSNFLHGQRVKITLADDPNYYYLGRLNISGFDPNKHYQHVTIEYQVDPYKYEHEEYDSGTRTVSTTDSVTAAGSPMAVIPTITVHSNKFVFHQHNALTRAEAIYMLYQLGGYSWSTTLTESKFLDVSEDDYYWDAVLWAEQYGITSGITENIFGGNNVCTRAMFVTMLMAYEWYPDWPLKSLKKGNIPFTDVPINTYYYKAVKQSFYEGLIAGDGNGHFFPNNPITREQACAILYKRDPYADVSGVGDVIIDLEGEVTIAPWYYVAVVKLFNEGIITGYSDGTYKPANYITRGQFVTMLYAAAGRPSVSGLSHPFTDVTSDMYCNDAVKYCYDYGCISGTSETTFSPERSMLRKEMLQVLFMWGNKQALTNSNLDYFDPDGDEDSDQSTGSGYVLASDVPNTAYYYNALIWGITNEITTLDAGHMFYPNNKATRAMAAQMLYKLLKILNDWEDDEAATIDATENETITHTETSTNDVLVTNPQWRQGYYDSDENDLVTETSHLRTVFLGLSQSTFGNVTHIVLDVPTEFLWRIHWFSYVDNSTQTLLSETAWAYGSSSQQVLSKPSGATNFMIGLMFRDGATSSTQTDNVSLTWEVGSIGTQGDDISGSIVNTDIKSNMFDVSDADSVIVTWSITDNDWGYVLYWYTSNERDRDYYISDTDWQTPTGSSYRVHNKPAGAKYACFLLTDGSNQQMYTSQAQYFSAQTNRTVLIGANITSSDGDDVTIYRRTTTTTTTEETIYGVSDINKYTVDYSDAVKYCYQEDLIEPMIKRAPMDITLENGKGSATASIPSGTEPAPELIVVDGENEFTVEGDGTYRIQFKRGSL